MLREITLTIHTRTEEDLATIERDIKLEIDKCTIADLTIVKIEEKEL